MIKRKLLKKSVRREFQRKNSNDREKKRLMKEILERDYFEFFSHDFKMSDFNQEFKHLNKAEKV